MTAPEAIRHRAVAPNPKGSFDWLLGVLAVVAVAGAAQVLAGEPLISGLVLVLGLALIAPVLSLNVLLVLLTFSAFVSLPAPFDVTIPISGLVVRPYEIVLFGCAVCALITESRSPYVSRRLYVFGLALVLAILLGWAAGNSLFRIFGDIRYVVEMLLAFIVFSVVAVNPSRVRMLLRLALIMLWVSATSSIAVSAGWLGFGGRERAASLDLESTAAAARLLSPATYPSLAVLCGVLALVSLDRLGTRTALLYAVPAGVVVALSFSRNSFLGLAGALLFALIAAALAGMIWRPIAITLIAAGVVGIGVLFTGYVLRGTSSGGWFSLQVSSFNERVIGGLTESGLQNDGSAQFRFQQEDLYLRREISNSPVIGHGMGFPYKPLLTGRSLSDKSDYLRYYAHNTYLWFWVKSGLVGLVAFLYTFATPVVAAVRGRQDIELASGAAVTGLLACAFVVPMPLGTPTAVLLGCAAGLCAGAVEAKAGWFRPGALRNGT